MASSFNPKNNISSYDMIKIMVELEEKNVKRKNVKKVQFEDHKVWFM